MKWILLLLLIIPTSLAFQIEYGTDNITWQPVENIHLSNNSALQVGLQSGTQYYFRARINESYSWTYVSAETLDEVNNMSLSLVIGLGIVSVILLFIAFRLESEHFILKLLLLIFAVLMLTLIPSAIISDETATGSTFLKIIMWFWKIITIYIVVYIFWAVAKRGKTVSTWLSRK